MSGESKDAGNNAQGKVRDIGERTFSYALRVIRLYKALESGDDGAARIIGKQLLRSATAVGASIQEARGSESRADFIHKHSIAQKEANESLYWLRMLKEARLVPARRLTPLIDESKELVAIITSIVVKAKRKREGKV